LGDSAFFKGLNIYLKTNAFKNAEVPQLRLALEEASGLDLNWFFNQWYYGAGHPILSISYEWHDATKTESVYLSQTQNGQIFKLPVAVDIYAGGKSERRNVWMNDKSDTLTFQLAGKPDLVNVDGDKVLLAQKKDNKSLDEFVFQYFNAPLYLDRSEAIDAAAASQTNPGAQKVLIAALKDKYYGLRIKAIRALDMKNDTIRSAALPILMTSAQTDNNTLARAAAINALGQLKIQANIGLYTSAITSQSYAIQGAALAAIDQLDPAQALTLAKGFEKDNEGGLTQSIIMVYATSGGNEQWPFVFGEYNKADFEQKFNMIRGSFAAMIGHVESPELAQQGIGAIKDFGIKTKQLGISSFVITALGNIKSARSKLNDSESAKAADDAVAAINDAK
jgi:aminopeptidase N